MKPAAPGAGSERRQQITYIIAGAATTACNIGLYTLLHTILDVHSDIANAAAWIGSVILAYVLNRLWVFQSSTRGKDMLREIAAFFVCRFTTGLLDEGLMHLATEIIGPAIVPARFLKLWAIAAKVTANVIVIVLNYILSKKMIFKDKACNSKTTG